MTRADTIHIDGRLGEGGGQVLRTSLSLAAALGRPVAIEHVRGGRKKPGLMRQHRACLRAAAEICGGTLEGGTLGSTSVRLVPGGPVRGGDYTFAVGSAGSALLVLQTVLVPLLLADRPSTLTLTGGTHNPGAPSFEAIAHGFLPCLARMGAEVTAELVRPGFLPAGGGEVRVRIEPLGAPRPFVAERAPEAGARKRLIVRLHGGLSETVAEREWEAFRALTGWPRSSLEIVHTDGPSRGNAAVAVLGGDEVAAVLTSLGARSVSSERVGKTLARAVQKHVKAGAPVDAQLADQLMLPMALLAGGSYLTGPLSRHASTNAEVIGRFLPGSLKVDPVDGTAALRVCVAPR